jgi:hypothetical protein
MDCRRRDENVTYDYAGRANRLHWLPFDHQGAGAYTLAVNASSRSVDRMPET